MCIRDRDGGGADAAGRGAAGVEDDQDAAVAFGAPGPDDHVRAAGGGTPVDRAHVVAHDVLAQGVELRALAAHQGRMLSLQLAELGQLRGQVLAAEEGRQHPHGPGHVVRPLAGGHAEGAERPHRDRDGLAVAAPRRRERRDEAAALAARDVEAQVARARAGRRRPGVTQRAAYAPASGVLDDQLHRDRLAQPYETLARAPEAQRAHAPGEQQVDRDERAQQQQQAEHGVGGSRGEQHAHGAQRRDQPRAAGQRHQRGTGTEASTPSSSPSGVAPSSSASGRSWTRCRRAGLARAFTSSGVT